MLRFKSLALIAAFGFAATLPALSQAQQGADDGLALLALVDDDNAPPPPPPPPPPHEGAPQGKHDGPRENRGDHPRGERIMHELFKGITLSDAQKESLKKMHEDNMAKGKAFAESHKDELKKQHEIMGAWRKANQEKFKALRIAMEDARENKDRQAMQKAQADLKALLESRPKMPEDLKAGLFNPEKAAEQIRGILTKDQIPQFDANLKEIKEKREKFEKDGPPPRPEGEKGDGERGGNGDGEGRPHHRHAPKPE